MKKVKVVVSLLVLFCMFLLQGCNPFKPETSHLVELSESKRTLLVDLKASTKEGYEWQYLFENMKNITESSKDISNYVLNDTADVKYEFIASDVGTNTLYLILVRNGDYETAKVFAYELSINEDTEFSIDSKNEYDLKSDIKLYKRVAPK